MRKRLLFLFAAFATLVASAQTKVEIDGIWYNLDESTQQAEVTFKGDSYYDYDEYSGSITIPATVIYNDVVYSVTSIEEGAFESCSNLTIITIPESVMSIGEGAFHNCSSLTSITIPEGSQLTSIVNHAFFDCSSLTSITIPESVTSIGEWAFCRCSSLTTITIPENVTSIGNIAFAGCSSLTVITCKATIPPAIGGSSTFSNVDKSIPIYVPEGSEEVYQNVDYWSEFTNFQPLAKAKVEIDGIWYNLDESTQQAEVTYKGDSYDEFTDEYSGSITIPTTVTHEGVIYNVTSIEGRAFSYCNSLTSIIIPKGVTSIEEETFCTCRGLTTVTIPEGVTSIGEMAFAYCSELADITIPRSVTHIEDWAFYCCFSLTTITCYAVTPPAMAANYNTFSNVSSSTPLYVPAGSVEAYQLADGWSKFTNILPLAAANEYTLSVSAAGYATLFLDYAAEIPNGVEVFYASSVEDDRLKMTKITGVLPAGTGVIVRAAEGTYTFTESDETPEPIESNLLVGTTTKTLITTQSGYAYYVLANVEGVAMYKPSLTDGCFYNNANKAYLKFKVGDLDIFDDETNTEEEGGQLSNRLRFDFGGTTDIEQTTVNGGQTTVIYDLQGRKVADTGGLKGIYIVNGRKVVIK